MPEATVDEDRDPGADKYNVRTTPDTRNNLAIEAIAEPEPMQFAAQR